MKRRRKNENNTVSIAVRSSAMSLYYTSLCTNGEWLINHVLSTVCQILRSMRLYYNNVILNPWSTDDLLTFSTGICV